MFDPDDLPINPNFEALKTLIGEDLVVVLSEKLGGRRIRVPVTSGRHSVLSSILGLDAAEKISEAYGGMNIDVPISQGRRAQIKKMRASGKTVSQVAASVKCTERYVYFVCNNHADEQPQLFPQDY